MRSHCRFHFKSVCSHTSHIKYLITPLKFYFSLFTVWGSSKSMFQKGWMKPIYILIFPNIIFIAPVQTENRYLTKWIRSPRITHEVLNLNPIIISLNFWTLKLLGINGPKLFYRGTCLDIIRSTFSLSSHPAPIL